MVPFLGVLPIGNVRSIASLVSHLPKYYDRSNVNCRLLLYALRRYDKIDALYKPIAEKLLKLGVPERKINFPRRNFVNHRQLKPEKKERVVTGFWYDPSAITNKSVIHVSIERYDNATNLSLLEGMAAGCAIITNMAGLTGTVVTPDIGIRVDGAAKSIAGALIRLLNDPAYTATMGRNSREKILAEHNIDIYLDYIVKIHDLDCITRIINGETKPVKLPLAHSLS